MRSKLLASTAAATNSSKRSRPWARQRFMPRPRNNFFRAGPYILFAEEAPIRSIAIWGMVEGGQVIQERGFHLILVGRISVQYLILGNQTLSAFGEKHFVAELDWG